MTALAAHIGYSLPRLNQQDHTPPVKLRLRPTKLELLDEATDLNNVPDRKLDEGLDRLLRDIENFQEPERWDGMS
jgi:hypothetical protein